MSDTIKDLIARIEAASGPDRELDFLIAVLIDWRWDGWEDGEATIKNMMAKHGMGWALDADRRNSIWRFVPAYTAGVDPALTLVTPNHSVDLTTGGHWPNRARILAVYLDGDRWLHRGGDPHYCSNAATPALAICAAALKARMVV